MKKYNLFIICSVMAILLGIAGFEIYSNKTFVLKTENRNATTLSDIKKFTDVENFLIDQFPGRTKIISAFNDNISAVNTQVASAVKMDIVDLGDRYFIPDQNFYTEKLTDYDLDPALYAPMVKTLTYLKNQIDVPIYYMNDGRKHKHPDFYEKYGLEDNYEKYEDGFLKELPQGVKFIDIEWKWDEVLKFLYKTDHHLNYLGTIDVYKKFMDAKGEKNYFMDPPIKYYEGAKFYGSDAKAVNKYDVYDEVYSWDYDKMNFKYLFNNKPYIFKNIDTNDIQRLNDEKANYYAESFSNDISKLEIINPDNPNGKKLLIIGESYTNSLNNLLAYNYSYVMDLDLRFYEGTFGEKADIKKIVKEKGIDEILIYTDLCSVDSISMKMN